MVVGTDTIRLVIPAGLAIRAATDSAAVPESDTTRVTISDTMRVTVTDTVRVRTEERVPVSDTADETEMRRLMEPVYFATGSTSLGPQGRVKVGEIAEWMKTHAGSSVAVTGFADASGSVSANEAVAQKRAESVRDELVRTGVAATRISTSRRLAPAGAQPSAKDRRAEVRFMP